MYTEDVANTTTLTRNATMGFETMKDAENYLRVIKMGGDYGFVFHDGHEWQVRVV